MSISINKLNTDLLGEGQLNLLASWSIQFSDTLFNSLSGILNFWNNDALVLSDVFAANTGQKDWLVDTGLDWFWIGNGDWDIDWGHNWDIVLGLLGDLVAVVVSVSTMSIAMTMAITMASWLAHSDHLDICLLLEGDFNSLGIGAFFLLLVAVAADLIGDLLNAFSAHCTGHIIAKFSVNNDLDGQVNI